MESNTGSTENPYQWIGREGYYLDPGTARYNLRRREYQANIARFLQQDPLGLDAGDANLYRYVENDPVNQTDPSGLQGTRPYYGNFDPSNSAGFQVGTVYPAGYVGRVVGGVERFVPLDEVNRRFADDADLDWDQLFLDIGNPDPTLVGKPPLPPPADDTDTLRSGDLPAGGHEGTLLEGADEFEPTVEAGAWYVFIFVATEYAWSLVGQCFRLVRRPFRRVRRTVPRQVPNKGAYGPRSIGSAQVPDPKVLQTGGHTITNRTRKALGLTQDEAKRAMEALKRDLGQGASHHGHKILDNGDVLDSNTGDLLGNLFDYLF